MKISEMIRHLQSYQDKFGDVTLLSNKSDGRSSWISPIERISVTPSVKQCCMFEILGY